MRNVYMKQWLEDSRDGTSRTALALDAEDNPYVSGYEALGAPGIRFDSIDQRDEALAVLRRHFNRSMRSAEELAPNDVERARGRAYADQQFTDQENRPLQPQHSVAWRAFAYGCASRRGARGILEDVQDFHDAMDVPTLAIPQFPSKERMNLRVNLIEEEWTREAKKAIEEDYDFVETADGLADLIYVATGTMLEFGIPAEVWDEVQRSNMAKRDPETGKVIRREDGKVLKPEGWTRPDVEGVLKAHGYEPGKPSNNA